MFQELSAQGDLLVQHRTFRILRTDVSLLFDLLSLSRLYHVLFMLEVRPEWLFP